jgi:hypothetical protein
MLIATYEKCRTALYSLDGSVSMPVLAIFSKSLVLVQLDEPASIVFIVLDQVCFDGMTWSKL